MSVQFRHVAYIQKQNACKEIRFNLDLTIEPCSYSYLCLCVLTCYWILMNIHTFSLIAFSPNRHAIAPWQIFDNIVKTSQLLIGGVYAGEKNQC